MIITHTMDWDKCLSHQIWPAIKKGWKDEGKPVHFFWGLAGKNIPEIQNCIARGEEYWYVDVGYMTEQITRYPEPKINNYDTTYFRIVKGGIHTKKGKVGSPARHKELLKKGIDAEFKGWTTNTDHVLLCPSSPTVTFHINAMTQEEWIKGAGEEIRKHTERNIRLRNKPRPHNEWWGKDIKEDLKGAHCLVTNMSLAAVDAVLNMVPVIADANNCAWPISSREPKFVEKPMKPGRKTVTEWLNWLTHHQFTIQEIEDGVAYKVLQDQYNNE
tara:strand:- start:63 stop:878 length:816 start_codon:yes stop_codon:yes gene_type:complete